MLVRAIIFDIGYLVDFFLLFSHVPTKMLFLLFSRGANYLTQILLRPGASDITGSFR